MQRVRSVQLGDLVQGISGISIRLAHPAATTAPTSSRGDTSVNFNDRTLEISGLTEDSRAVKPGHIFVARVGAQFDGRNFIADALARGAVAVIVEKTAENLPLPPNLPRTPLFLIEVVNLSAVLGIIAERFYGQPTSGPNSLKLIGITGTNGKTTTAHLVYGMLNHAGKKCGLIGTVSIDAGGPAGLVDSELTTPLATELSAVLSEMVANGCEYAVMEVSSHALAQGRVRGLKFARIIFTNLSGDHLDYHGTMARYAAAKAGLFKLGGPDCEAIINFDDAAAPQMIQAAKHAGLTVSGVGKFVKHHQKKSAPASKIYPRTWEVEIRKISLHGMNLAFHFNPNNTHHGNPRETGVGGGGEVVGQTKLVGTHNALNLLQACAVVHSCGIEIKEICANLVGQCVAPPGRLEPVYTADGTNLGFAVLVDYAHTDDALRNVLNAVRPLVHNSNNDNVNPPEKGRLIVVFGCGGDRDRTKRPRMLQAACAGSDIVMVTSDNPRTEPAEKILSDILTGISVEERASREREGRLLVEVDRARAIAQVLGGTVARPGDVVVIAGKGHEDYQIIGRTKHAFDDRIIARNLLTQRQHLEAFWDVNELARIINAQLVQHDNQLPPKKPNPAVSIDSRNVKPGTVFVAIPGARFDGHDYVQNVLREGNAALIIVNAAWWETAKNNLKLEPDSAAILVVEQTITALGKLAARYRHRCLHNVTVIAITGSCGKTTTKNMVAAVLRQARTGHAAVKSFNNAIGVPLTILHAKPQDDYLIVEVGTNAPGEIKMLGEMVAANLGVITNIGRAHLAGLGSVAGVAREKTALFQTLAENDPWAIWPADGINLKPLLPPELNNISFGENVLATVRLAASDINESGCGMNFSLADGSNWQLPALGKHQVLNAVVALSVGRRMGLPDNVIQAGLAKFKVPALRFERQLIPQRNLTIFNDAYNANPESMRASIQTFIKITERTPMKTLPGRRILVLGEMLELGEASADCHREIVQWVESLVSAGALEQVFLVGEAFARVKHNKQIKWVGNGKVSDLARIADELSEGDLILIKGSRGVGLERLLTILAEDENNHA